MTAPGLSTADPPGRQARLLLRGARVASLGTIGAEGIPSVTLITPATMPDLSVLMLLSGLSEHRRNLAEDGRCGLMVTGPALSDNPQTAPRLSLDGRASPLPEPEQPVGRRRWLAAHPYAEGYAGLGDFALWRFVPERARFIGGFAAAHRLSLEALLPLPTAVIAVAEAEEAIIAEFGAGGPWRLGAVDVDGCDVVTEGRSRRIAFDRTIGSAEELHREVGLMSATISREA